MTDNEAPQASAYLRMLWGDAGELLEASKPPPPPPPDPRQHFSGKDKAKVGYPSRWHAVKAIAFTQAKPDYCPPPPGMALHEYQCEVCEKWHIGRAKIED